MRKKLPAFALVLALALSAALCPCASAVNARGFLILEADSGRVLAEADADRILPPASTTKIMTALLAVESGRLDELVTVSPAAAATGGSSMYLTAGERLTLADLVRGLLIVSGNDAAVAIAEFLAGTPEAFAGKMNDRARALGAAHTRFTNPHGLPDASHVTTARDLALMAREAMKHAFFRETVACRAAVVTDESGSHTHYLRSKNRILTELDGGCGVKTGYTAAAGRCLVSAAERGGMTLIAVVLNAPDMFADSKSALNAAFASYEKRELIAAGQAAGSAPVAGGRYGTVPVVTAGSLILPISIDGTDLYSIKYTIDDLTAPVRVGDAAGRAEVRLGSELYTVPLAAAAAVAANTPEANFFRLIRGFWR